jgi:hypothetical protein
MKMVKSLLLGSAAGLVAIAGAQAADLPVKAKPVQYVKICSLYGVGFYYIPGTDMCLKIGGWVRAEYGYGANGNITWGPYNGNFNDRSTSNSTFRARGYLTADARDQTEYGTVRGYIAVGINTNDVGLNSASNTFSSNRAFIQWAGFTFGLAQSFFDFYSVPATSYWGNFPASDTGDPGWFTMGYTAQFGNGFSATLAAEERRITQIVGVGHSASDALVHDVPVIVDGTITPGAFTANAGYGGFQAPDIVGNLRVDQAWGSAQIMAAYHDVNAIYYDPVTLRESGHPSDKAGWVVGAGIKLNAPFIGQGDYLQAQVNYTKGALKYIFQTPNSNWGKVNGFDVASGVLSDAVYGGCLSLHQSCDSENNPTDVELTTAWNVNAAYEHFWNPRWRTSLYGGYAAVSYSDLANTLLCAGEQEVLPGEGQRVGCDNNWQTYWIGSRTQWNVTKDFYMGVDVLYSKLLTASPAVSSTGTGSTSNGLTLIGGTPWAGRVVSDVDNWAVRFRVHRDFYP